ncbi:protein-serine O-palmitoleoyltransferase porcupine [Sabethes cyaneus]|uniref:protein-serine O-palmitoleoyltransferase porcupine n=1 Tax=Sabethes cyaneus TaxID=53552 RepID=UPI00237D54F9|nr:protein-serine O-palmitoleoyltransferase porcupine [Sabethes cyaneus]
MEDYYDGAYVMDDDDMYDYDSERIVPDSNTANWRDVYDGCVSPSLVQVSRFVAPFLMANMALCLLSKVQGHLMPSYPSIVHFLNLGCGIYLLSTAINEGYWYIYLPLLPAYLMLKYSARSIQRIRFELILSVLCIVYLIVCELYEKDTDLWHHIRGVLMVIVMKIISLGHDTKRDPALKNQLDVLTFLGYICCPANCIFGPWTSFKDYLDQQRRNTRFTLNLEYFIQIVLNLTLAIVGLLVSNCVQVIFISKNTWKWIAAYCGALSFRASHYFVSFVSQATMVSAGYNSDDKPVSKSALGKHSGLFGYTVTLPWRIEFPCSLVHVVVAWNIPMHNFLKQYVFRMLKPYGMFTAILLTYVTSSVLHGLNFKMWAILLTLGIWSYVEYNIRWKLARAFSACVAIGRCNSPCTKHKLGKTAFLTVVINLTFFCLTVIHLIYLGALLDTSSEIYIEGFSFWHAVHKWQELHYLSHWLLLSGLVFNWLI